MLESIVALIAGAIVIWSFIIRYRTINTPEFTKNTQITIALFAAMGAGLPMLDFKKTMQAFHLATNLLGEIGIFIILASPLLLFPLFKILEGYSLAYSFQRYNFKTLFDWVLDKFVIILISLFALTYIYHGLSFGLQQAISHLTEILFFISFAITLGFIHSLLGSIIAGINIALIISHFFTNGVLGFDLGSVFDVFEQVGISSAPLKWLIVIASTTLGLHGYITLENLRDAIRDLTQ